MVDREELQRLAKEVEALRQQFDEIQNRTQQIDGILEEHDVTNGILGAYIDTQRKFPCNISPFRRYIVFDH